MSGEEARVQFPEEVKEVTSRKLSGLALEFEIGTSPLTYIIRITEGEPLTHVIRTRREDWIPSARDLKLLASFFSLLHKVYENKSYPSEDHILELIRMVRESKEVKLTDIFSILYKEASSASASASPTLNP